MKLASKTTKSLGLRNQRESYSGFTNESLKKQSKNYGSRTGTGRFAALFVLVLLVVSAIAVLTCQNRDTDTIRVDGSFEDWRSVEKTTKARDLSVPDNIDIAEYATVETGINVAFYAKVYGCMLSGDPRYIVETPSENPVYVSHQRETAIPNTNGRDVAYVFVDTDNSPATGFKPSPNFAVGADKAIEIVGKNGRIEASRVLSFAGIVQQEWTWTVGESVAAATDGKHVETMAGKRVLGVGERYAVYFYMVDWQNEKSKIDAAIRCENSRTSPMDMYLKAVDGRTLNLVESTSLTPKGTPRAPIRINGDADFTPMNGVVSGAGTQNDPYVIESWDINAGGQGCGIYIGNTTSYFIVRNCYVYNSSGNAGIYYWNSGIALFNVRNGIIGGNTVFNSTSFGIYIASSSTLNTVYSNRVSNNNFGIYLTSSTVNRIDKNDLTNNTYGVVLSSSSTNTVTNNTVSYSTIYGIYLASSTSNLILYNHLRGNGNYGVYLTTGSNSNEIWWNNFWQNNGATKGVNGNCQAYDGVGTNRWNNSTILAGNYWSNWDGNGWATPSAYPIDGGAGAADRYPLDTPIRAPIRINSDADFTPGNGVAGGAGTLGDPYIIEGWLIDGTGYGYCIYIGNTTKDFVVRNCELHDASGNSDMYYWNAGIALFNVTNATVSNNYIHSCEYGIWMYHTSYISMYSYLKFNVVGRNKYGVICWNVRDISVTYNIIQENEYDGMDITSGQNLKIICNNISSNNFRGIYLVSTTNSEINYNQFYRNTNYAVFLTSGSASNLITYNNFWRNNEAKGVNGKPQAYDGEMNNIWYNTAYKEGNYWGNWDGMNWGTSSAYPLDGLSASDWYPLSRPALGPLQIVGDEQFAEIGGVMGWPGDGSTGDPYTIEGYLQNARGGTYGIKIQNTNLSFVIRNCEIRNATATNGAGISLANATGGAVDSNNITNNYFGIYSTYSTLDILENTLTGNTIGMYLYDYTNYTNVSRNEVLNNTNQGLAMVYANNCTVDNNIFSGNGLYGVVLFAAQNISIVDNELINGSTGIFAVAGVNITVTNNKVLNNTNVGMYLITVDTAVANNNISNNKYGIVADMCERTNITYNDFYLNTNYSIHFRLTTCTDNHVHHNRFYQNNGSAKGYADGKCQARDDTGGVLWYDAVSKEGNYWSNWNGSGWGTPNAYPIEGSAGASDWYPLGYGKHGPIHINGNADFATQAAAEGWQGNGSESNPYIIERMEIDANGGSYCIWIENTDVYFVVRDCDLSNATSSSSPYYALMFNNVKNGFITNIDIHHSYQGLQLGSGSTNNTVDNVTVYSCNSAVITLWYSPSNKITSSTGALMLWGSSYCVIENFTGGGYVYNSHYTAVRNSTINGGITFMSSSHNQICNNTLTGGGEGIFLSGTTNNTILNNTITANSYGIRLNSCGNTYIANNNISGNTVWGIYGLGAYSNYNRITNNTISGTSGGGGGGGLALAGHYNNVTSNYIGNNNGYGVQIIGSDYLNFTNNTVVGSSYCGVYLEGSNGVVAENTITGNPNWGLVLRMSRTLVIKNNCSNNAEGIMLDPGASNNTLRNNTVTGNTWIGIEINYQACDNLITGNIIANNGKEGILVGTSSANPRSDRNIITHNIISSNAGHGVYIRLNCTGNVVHHNRFIGNNGATRGVSGNCQAYDNSTGNSWFDAAAKEGNYWSNWNRLGWGTPGAYPIDGSGGASDWYPLRTARGTIHITSNSEFTSANGVVGGTGTQADPYLIAGWEIDANGGTYGIWIENTDAYFVILSCLVWNATNSGTPPLGAGIAFNGVKNGRIENTTCYGSRYGIYFYGNSNGNIVINNDVSNNTLRGIFIASSSSNQIQHNIACNNIIGIYLTAAGGNTVAGNAVKNNSQHGFYITANSNYNQIISNDIKSNLQCGIYIYSSSTYNNITNNNITKNSLYGIYIYGSNNNEVTNNWIYQNTNYGVYVAAGSAGNTIVGNRFVSNNGAGKGVSGNCQAYDRTGTNYWHDSITQSGNYWNNWDGKDWGSASAYPIDGGTGASDWYPVRYISRGPIHITSNSEFTSDNGVLEGTGALSDPYIIEGWEIDAKGGSYAIWIENTNAYFVVRRCHVFNATDTSSEPLGKGIALRNTQNGLIENNLCSKSHSGIYLYGGAARIVVRSNNCTNNSYYGIWLWGANTNEILRNLVITNGWGIALGASNYNIIANNTLLGNINTGIQIGMSGSNTIENNTLTGSNYGIELSQSSNNTVSWNSISGTSIGINLYKSTGNAIAGNNVSASSFAGVLLSESKANTITNNGIAGNTRGIYLANSNNTAITYNNISSNTQCGLYLTSTRNTTIANNTIAENGNYGIYLTTYSNNNTMTHNTVRNHTGYGIYLTSSSTCNFILRNNFLNNNGNKGYTGTSQAYDEVGGNFWYDNSAQEGNYWSNWDGSGWGSSSAYPIDGGVDASDWYPLGSPVSEGSAILCFTALAFYGLVVVSVARKKRN
ncbi:MAG: right-handed parallel beta-helix repeat-containing protein [Thermoplasmata archaeon]|nr:right-handed parallel beta-helix repeat-containing protein [Thermoplasmata archaeon]